MAKKTLIRNALMINEGEQFCGDLLIKGDRIDKIAAQIDSNADQEIDANGMILIPGVIDDQVHFREPGLTHKATVYSESRAAAAGGVTSFMDMPNVNPATLTQELLEQKYLNAQRDSAVNYSFYMGASNDNLEEVLKTNPGNVCGVKIFMGSSTGNMLVDETSVLESIFSKSEMLIATHCEDEETVRSRTEDYIMRFGEKLTAEYHPQIRSAEACYLSSSLAVDLARKYGTRLHVLHLTTAEEMELFDNSLPLSEKRITAEVCVHHLFFNESAYPRLGNRLKCNPAVKSMDDQEALWKALLKDKLDVVATDHAPHTIEEKSRPYINAPSGLPLVQHSLLAMLDMHKQGRIEIDTVVKKMCHAPAIAFRVKERGFLREGYFADLVLIDPEKKTPVTKENILFKCAWSPFEGHTFSHNIKSTIVNGELVYDSGQLKNTSHAQRLMFDID
jgi:dihydroorotase